MTLGLNGPKLNSRPVYCSGLYGRSFSYSRTLSVYFGARGHGLFLIPIQYGFLFYHFSTFKVFILPTLHQVVVVYIVVFVPSPLQPLQNLSRLSHGSCSREGSSIVRHFIQTGAFSRVLFPQLHIFLTGST